MIFNRKKYPLPKFPEDVIPTFLDLCEELPIERVETFTAEIKQLAEHFIALSSDHPLLDIESAEKLCLVCGMLIEEYEKLSSAHRRLVIGAIRYFAEADDPLCEKTFASGFDDDVKVMNHVLEEIGREDLIIELV